MNCDFLIYCYRREGKAKQGDLSFPTSPNLPIYKGAIVSPKHQSLGFGFSEETSVGLFGVDFRKSK